MQFPNLDEMKKLIIYCSILLSISSCSKNHISSPEKIELKSDKKLIEEIISPEFLTRVNNMLVISSSHSDSMLYVYSLPDLKYLFCTGRRGKGPKEIQLFPMFCESNNQALYIWGFSPTTIRKFDLEQKGELTFSNEMELPQYEAYNNMHIIKDSLFIYYLPDQLKVVKFDLKNNKYLDEIKMEKDNHHESYFYSNRGTIAANNSYLVFGYIFKKEINIYNINDFKLHKHIIGEYKHKVPKVGNLNTPVYYTQIVAGENFFYALCKDNENNETLMEVYDYNGVFVNKFAFDITPQLFAIDEMNKAIYGYASNKKYEPYLLRFSF